MDERNRIEYDDLRSEIRDLKMKCWRLEVELKETKCALDSLDPKTMTLKP